MINTKKSWVKKSLKNSEKENKAVIVVFTGLLPLICSTHN